MSKRPDFEVFVSEKTGDDKTFYQRVGAAWNVAKGGISIKLNCLPTDGSLVMFPRRENENDN